jgi:hypothetical protein
MQFDSVCGEYVRHEAGGDDLEGQCEPSQEAGDVAADARAQGQKTSEKRTHGEEQADDDEWEHESGRQVVVPSPVL